MKDTATVIKLNDTIYYATWIDYFINLLLHNYLFEDTAYQFAEACGSRCFARLPAVRQQLFFNMKNSLTIRGVAAAPACRRSGSNVFST